MNGLDSKHYILDISLDPNKVKKGYPFNLNVVKNLKKIKFHPKVTFLVGDNGAGKSSLLEAIAIGFGFNPEGGTWNFNFATNETHSKLYESLIISKSIHKPRDGFFLRAESFYNVATEIDNIGVSTYYGGKSLHKQSHGESFISLIENKFRGNGLYILDEPEAALSPQNQIKLISLIYKISEKNSQFIIATHSPILLAYPQSYIYEINDESIDKLKYEETSHYRVTKEFLTNYKQIIKDLI